MRFKIDELEVYFPYPAVYREQYDYMCELKRTLDARVTNLSISNIV